MCHFIKDLNFETVIPFKLQKSFPMQGNIDGHCPFYVFSSLCILIKVSSHMLDKGK